MAAAHLAQADESDFHVASFSTLRSGDRLCLMVSGTATGLAVKLSFTDFTTLFTTFCDLFSSPLPVEVRNPPDN